MNYEYFIGKVCTIFTVPLNRDFKSENKDHYPQMIFDYFMGVVESVDDTTLLISRVQGGLKTLFFLKHIVGIAEEEVILEGTKEHKELSGQLRAIPQVLDQETQFIDPAQMALLSKELLKTSGK